MHLTCSACALGYCAILGRSFCRRTSTFDGEVVGPNLGVVVVACGRRRSASHSCLLCPSLSDLISKYCMARHVCRKEWVLLMSALWRAHQLKKHTKMSCITQ